MQPVMEQFPLPFGLFPVKIVFNLDQNYVPFGLMPSGCRRN